MIVATSSWLQRILRTWQLQLEEPVGSDSPFIATPSGQTQRVGPASAKRPGTLGSLTLVIVTLGFIVTAGCATKLIDQVGSLQGTRTEELRDWVREDPQRDKLIVFVHGFNSSKEKAWGQFPDLLKGDADFTDFNIHRFGYPTKLCRQVSDIRNQGELLAAFLTSTLQRAQPKYRQVVLIGHSMGGLVILHALQKLERDHLPLLTEQDLKVLTFGTPYSWRGEHRRVGTVLREQAGQRHARAQRHAWGVGSGVDPAI